jgi:hypothetical protein
MTMFGSAICLEDIAIHSPAMVFVISAARTTGTRRKVERHCLQGQAAARLRDQQ